MQNDKNQKSRDFDEDQEIINTDEPSFIVDCYQQKKVSLLAEQALVSDKSFYVNFNIEQLQNHKIYIMYVTSYRLYLMCTLDTEIVTIPHSYIREYNEFDNQIRFSMKTGLRCFLIPVESQETQQIFRALKFAYKQIPFCTHVKFSDQQPEIYDCLAEMERMRINWQKVVAIDNTKAKQVETYPKIIFVPPRVDKQVVKQLQLFRFNSRIPALTYYSNEYNVSLWRSGHNLNQQNTKYDIAYLESISTNLLIIEIEQSQSRRQSSLSFNHFSNQIKYSMYKFETLYAIKSNYERLLQSYIRDDGPMMWKALSKWYEEVDLLIKCAFRAAEQMKNKRPVLVQENDFVKIESNRNMPFNKGGVDRACQICSLIQIIFDPYYRSIKGFPVLIEKEFVSFGYPFQSRCGVASPNSNSPTRFHRQQQSMMSSLYRQSSQSTLKQFSPTFIQFLQCVNQVINCFPQYFEYSSQYLAQIGYELYSGKYNNFLYNTVHVLFCMSQEKSQCRQAKNTHSLYQHLGLRKGFYNLLFCSQKSEKNLSAVRDMPNVKEYIVWKEYWDMVTKMNCAQKKGEDPLQIDVFRKLAHERKIKNFCKKS